MRSNPPISAQTVERAIEPILFALEDLQRHASSIRPPRQTTSTPQWWEWFCSLPTVDERRLACTIDAPLFHKQLVSLVQAEAKLKGRECAALESIGDHQKLTRARLCFSEISKEDLKVLASLGDTTSRYSDRPYFPLTTAKVAEQGLGLEAGLRHRFEGLNAGIELLNHCRVCALDTRLICLDTGLLENLEEMKLLLELASFGQCFTHDKSWFNNSSFSLGEFICWEVVKAIQASMQTRNDRKTVNAVMGEANRSNQFWTEATSLSRGEWIVQARRIHMTALAARETLSPIDRLRMSLEALAQGLSPKTRDVMFLPVELEFGCESTVSIAKLLGDIVAQAWRESFVSEFLTELSASPSSSATSTKSAKTKKKKRSRSTPAFSSTASVVVVPESTSPSPHPSEAGGPFASLEGLKTEVALAPPGERKADGGEEEEEKDEDLSSNGGTRSPPLLTSTEEQGQSTPSSPIPEKKKDDSPKRKHPLEEEAASPPRPQSEDVAQLTSNIAKLTEGMEAFQRCMLQELSQLKSAIAELQQVVLLSTQSSTVRSPPPPPASTGAFATLNLSDVPRSPTQQVASRKMPATAPPSPHPSSNSVLSSPGVPSPKAVAIPPPSRSASSTSLAGQQQQQRSHYRRASVSDAPYGAQVNSFRLRAATSSPVMTTMSKLQQPHQQHQHHPFAGVLYATGSQQQQQGASGQMFVPPGLYPPRPLQQHQIPQQRLQHPLHAPGPAPPMFVRPHEWHGTETLVFPPPATTSTNVRSSTGLSSASSSSVMPAPVPPSVPALLQKALAPPSSLTSFEMPPSFEYHRALADPAYSLSLAKDVTQFLQHCQAQRLQKASSEQLALQSMRGVVESVWPRARVKGYGSTVTGLGLPESDMDLVVCLPKVTVMQDAIAEEVGPLEGRTADERTSWQQKLAAALILAPWVDPDTLRTIQHAPMPVITLTTKGKPYFEVPIRLDVSFQSETHHGLATNKLVGALQREHSMLRPMVLVLKQFLADRGLGKGFSGGLSSYALVIMCTCFLNAVARVGATSNKEAEDDEHTRHSSPGGEDEEDENEGVDQKELGVRLIWFLRFFGEQFDTRLCGISITRGFFLRHISAAISATTSASSSSSSSQQHQQQQRRRSFRIEDLQLPPAAHGGAVVYHPHHGTAVPAHHHQQIMPQDLVPPHKFDPLLIEDPLQPGNNVGRNVFRIHQIQRACADALQCLRQMSTASPKPPVTWPLGCIISSWRPFDGTPQTFAEAVANGIPPEEEMGASSSVTHHQQQQPQHYGGRKSAKVITRSNSVV